MMIDSRKDLVTELNEILVRSYNKKIFTAASLAFSTPLIGKGTPVEIHCGLSAEIDGREVGSTTLYDLASLTKPLVTLLCTLFLVEKGIITWHDRLEKLLDKNIPALLRGIDLYSLLCHNSGLPAHRDYWKYMLRLKPQERQNWLKEEILSERALDAVGKAHVYSDLGYLLLGMIIEQQTGSTLDAFWYEVVARPLGLVEHLHFRPIPAVASQTYVCTGTCPWSGERLTGRVHDDNCRALGGVGGHAGLFGSAAAVLQICQELLRLLSGHPTKLPLSPETFKAACRKVGSSEWTAGFNLPSPAHSSSGTYFSPDSIGHLGFTGTSFWIDPQRQLIIVFLTNRVITGSGPDEIKKLRPQIHDRIGEGIARIQRQASFRH